MHKTPDWYEFWWASVGSKEVDLGVGGIKLLKPEELMKGQEGYAFSSKGGALVGSEPGDWLEEWIVIGYETACGDPFFVSDEKPHPVFTAEHGQGSWSPYLVAPSLTSFGECLSILGQFAQGRSSPVELEANPPSEPEQEEFIKKIKQATGEDPTAWMSWAVFMQLDQERFEALLNEHAADEQAD